MGLNGKTFWRFQTEKKLKYIFRLYQATLWNTRPLNTTNDDGLCDQEELNRRKIEKSIHIKTWKFARLELRSQILTGSTFMYYLLVMTWSLTMAGLPRACENSKPHDYKQKYKKWRTFRKHGLLRGNNLKISDKKKNRNEILDFSKTTSGIHGPEMQLLNRDLVTRQK